MQQSHNLTLDVVRFFSDTIRCVLAIVFVYFASRTLNPPTDLTSWLPWGFLVVLVIGLGLALFRYRQPYAHAAKALNKAAREFEARRTASDQAGVAAPEPGSQAQESDTAPASGDDHADLRPKAFAGQQPLLDAWKEFYEARQGDHVSGPRRGRSTVSPAEHFTIARVLGRNPGSLPNALPGVFTAVGLLGTFVGIAMGLADIEPTAATEDLMDGIRTLMGGMSTAFVTSIVGITWSVWWLFEFRFAERKLKSRIDFFIAETVRMLRVEEPHETLVRIADANESAQRSADAIKDTATEIKGNVQSLGQDLADALEPYFEKHIGEPIRNLNTDLGRRQTEALGRMVEAFRDTLVSSVKTELSEFGQALRAATDHQTSAARELEGFFARLVEVSEVQMKLLSRTTEVATVFDRGLAALAAATEASEAAGKSASDTMATAREAMDSARDLGEESRQQLEVQKEVSEAARRAWDAQASLLEETQANFGRLATDLGDKIMEFQTASAQKISEVFHVFDSEMAKVADHLGGTLAELRDVTEELPGTVGRLRETTQDLADASQAQRDSLAKGLRAFEEVKTELVGKLEQTRGDLRDLGRALPAFAKAADALPRGIEAMVDGIEAAGARSEEDSRRMAETMEAGAGRLAEMVNSVGRSVEPVAEWTEKVTEGLTLLSERTEALTKVLSDRYVTVNQLPSPSRTVRVGTEAPASQTPAKPTPESTRQSQIADPPVTKARDDIEDASRRGVDTEAGRDGEHAVEATEAPRGWFRWFRGRRR